MKKILEPIGIFMLPFLIFYLAFAFYNVDFDFENWSKSNRAYCIAASLSFGAYFIFGFTALIKNDRHN